jgi:hypothetical protein
MGSNEKVRDWQTVANELGTETDPAKIHALVEELTEAMARANPHSKYAVVPHKKTA